MIQWYYHDAARGRVGPIDAEQLREAWRRREVQQTTLAWREGMADWQPLARLSAELALDTVSPDTRQPPPLPPTAAPQTAPLAPPPVAPRKGMSGCLIALIVGGALAIPVLGILAAIALPAYNDYTIRSKVAQGVASSGQLKTRIAEFQATEGRCPENGDPGFDEAGAYADAAVAEVRIGSLRKRPCAYEIHFGGAEARLEGKTLRFEGMPDETGLMTWDCSGGSLDRRYRPSICRID